MVLVFCENTALDSVFCKFREFFGDILEIAVDSATCRKLVPSTAKLHCDIRRVYGVFAAYAEFEISLADLGERIRDFDAVDVDKFGNDTFGIVARRARCLEVFFHKEYKCDLLVNEFCLCQRSAFEVELLRAFTAVRYVNHLLRIKIVLEQLASNLVSASRYVRI